jgi:hypothetical protein
VSVIRASWLVDESKLTMKSVYTILFLGLAMLAYAQSAQPQQSNSQPPASQPSNALPSDL